MKISYMKVYRFVIALALFSLFVTRLSLASLFKRFWLDEVYDLQGGALKTTFLGLLKNGPMGGTASPSPLDFMIDRFWMSLFGYHPQVFGDLRLLLRFPHVVQWALAGVAVYFFMEAFLSRKMPSLRPLNRSLVAAASAVFYHANTFASYYAIETRPYSLWCFFTTLHVLFFLWDVFFGLNRKQFYFYGIVCILLAFTTYASLGMILGTFMLQYFLLEKRKRLGLYAGLSAVCVGIGGWYFLKMPALVYPASWGLAFEELGEVIAKSLHSHSPVTFILTLFFFCFFMPFWTRGIKKYRVIYACVWGAIAYCHVLILSCLLHHYLIASRQFIFLVPYLTAAYGLGLFQLMQWVVVAMKRIRPLAQFGFVQVLVAWACISLTSRVVSDMKSIRHDLVFFGKRHALSRTHSTNCLVDSPKLQEADTEQRFEDLNNLCRSF